jgi:hypothetical protein
MSKRRPPHKAEPHLYVIATVNKNPIPKVNKIDDQSYSSNEKPNQTETKIYQKVQKKLYKK